MAGVVGLIAAVAAPWIQRSFRTGSLIAGATLGWALGMLLMPLADSILLLGIGWAIVTAVGGVFDVVATSYRLSLIPESMQGRINSVFRFIGFGTRPVTLALGGYLIATLGPRATLGMLAAGMVVTALATLFSSLRTLDSPR